MQHFDLWCRTLQKSAMFEQTVNSCHPPTKKKRRVWVELRVPI